MRFQDISKDKKTLYRLRKNETTVFFMLNRSGTLTFELSSPGAKAHIFSLRIGDTDESSLTVIQHHTAAKTTSSFIGKNIARGTARLIQNGLIEISKKAHGSTASQEMRSLLLSENASAVNQPTLEINTDDVEAHHAATTSTLDKEALFFTQSRGLSEEGARKLLISGFALNLVERIPNELPSEKNKVRVAIENALQDAL